MQQAPYPPSGSLAPMQPSMGSPSSIPEGEKSYLVTLLLSYLLGMFGADRFYLGKTRSAVWKLVTLGGFGYWWVIDLVLTLFGRQRDQWGLRLVAFGGRRCFVLAARCERQSQQESNARGEFFTCLHCSTSPNES